MGTRVTPAEADLASLASVIERFAAWPVDVLRPRSALQARLAQRIAEATGGPLVAPPARRWSEPAWAPLAPGIDCKLLAQDPDRDRTSMLVRLAPDASYPPPTDACVEELHLLAGELCIDDRRLSAGDYNHRPPGASDERVWSETGCTCLLITSTKDILR